MNKRLKLLLWLLFAAVVISGIYYFVMKPSDWASSDMATTTAGMATTTTATTTKPKTVVRTASIPAKSGTGTGNPVTIQPSVPGTPPTFTWTFVDRSNPHDTSALYTAVTLYADNNEYDLGTLSGICKTVADTDLKQAGEVSAIQCLNAGKGEEVGVFKQGSSYVLKSAQLVKGTQGNPDKYTAFTTIQTLK